MTEATMLETALERMAADLGADEVNALIIEAAAQGGDLTTLGQPLKELRSESGRKLGIGDLLAAEIMAAIARKVAER